MGVVANFTSTRLSSSGYGFRSMTFWKQITDNRQVNTTMFGNFDKIWLFVTDDLLRANSSEDIPLWFGSFGAEGLLLHRFSHSKSHIGNGNKKGNLSWKWCERKGDRVIFKMVHPLKSMNPLREINDIVPISCHGNNMSFFLNKKWNFGLIVPLEQKSAGHSLKDIFLL